jgi:preprotein translocase subunit SecD
VRNREAVPLLFILLLTALCTWISFAPDNTWLGRDVSVRLGLDLQGGTQVLLKAEGNEDRELMKTAATVIERRVNGLGVSEAIVQLSGTNRIIVELPGVKDPEQAIETLRGTGRLEFIDTKGAFLGEGTTVKTTGNPNPTMPAVDPNAPIDPANPAPVADETVYESITDGQDLDTKQVALRVATDNVNNQPAVSFAFTGDSATRLATFSAANIQKPMCIVLDNVVVSCPVIQSALIGGSGEITTGTREDAEKILNQLKYGSLPVTLTIDSSRTVSATLGANSVAASTTAGIVGLIVVALFMILYYRLPGLLATLALVIYTIIIFAIHKLVPITLTLSGIAGFILSIGLAVDANVLIFARLKEELRNKRSLLRAIESGFEEAWPAIRDSSASTLITSAILFVFGNSFGVSLIKGFALTLALGILLNLFTAVVVTRTFLRLVVKLQAAQNLWLYEIDSTSDLREQRTAQ